MRFAAILLSLVGMAAQEWPPVSYQPMAYPVSARNAGVSGSVILGYSLGGDGKPASVEILSGHRLLAPAAKANLDTWVFTVPASGAQSEQRRVTYVFEIVETAVQGYSDRKKQAYVLEGESLVRVRSAFSGTLSASDCPVGQEETASGEVLAGDSVTLFRGRCFGVCPSYEVTLYGDGRVVWKGIAFVEAPGERPYRIDAVEAKKVLRRFLSPEALQLCGQYVRGVSDNSSTRTAITGSGKQKIISDYGSASPKWFWELLADLDDVAQTRALRSRVKLGR